ncbi:hypothetical protein BKA69DRAFT_416758 [Paraphysoderma sedebokerense]|nr:hypothetical protein BKA69DRAFT_416758 [Paraphysoderma sedebokerense]
MGDYKYLFWDLDSDYSTLQLTFTYMTCGELKEINVTNYDLYLRTYSPTVLPRQAVSALNGFYYVPPRNYVGEVLINFTVNDGSSSHIRYDNRQAEPCTIKYLVRNVNDPPVANDISIATDEDTAISLTLNCTGIDPDDAITEFKIVPPAEHRLYQYTSDQIDYSRDVGQIIDDPQGRFWFSPSKDYFGAVVVTLQCRGKID